MMKKRILSALLLGSMLLSLAACDSDNDDKKNPTNTNLGGEKPAGIEAANYDLPFNIYAPDFGMYQRYFFADDAGTDVMTKAIYDRELAVEEHLGVQIDYTLKDTIEEVRTVMQSLVMTGEDTYQLFLTHCIGGVSAMVTEKLLYDFNDFEYIDMTQEWWNQQANEALEVNGHRYYAVSDYMLADPNCLLVNNDLLSELNFEENPYDLVREGEWTIDKMLGFMSKATKDNGDGRWDFEDQWGLATPNDWYCNSFIYSSGTQLVNKNEDGKFAFSFDDDRTYTMMEKLDALLSGADTYVYDYADNSVTEESLDISKGRSLFNITTVRDLYTLRDIDINFGILPYPKLDTTQTAYTTNDWSGMMCVPKTVKNTDMVGKVIELLSYYSGDTVKYAYYELMLGEKLTRDPESKEMLDYIFDGIVFDAGVNYFGFGKNMKEFFYSPMRLIVNGRGSSGFSSLLASYQPGVEAEIEQFNEEISNMQNTAE